jgi:hypothetical protein
VGPRGAGPGPLGAGALAGAGPLREGPPAETSSREDAPEGAPGKKPTGRVVVTRMMVPCGNDQSRRSCRTIGGTMETVVEPGCRGS